MGSSPRKVCENMPQFGSHFAIELHVYFVWTNTVVLFRMARPKDREFLLLDKMASPRHRELAVQDILLTTPLFKF